MQRVCYRHESIFIINGKNKYVTFRRSCIFIFNLLSLLETFLIYLCSTSKRMKVYRPFCTFKILTFGVFAVSVVDIFFQSIFQYLSGELITPYVGRGLFEKAHACRRHLINCIASAHQLLERMQWMMTYAMMPTMGNKISESWALFYVVCK